MIYEIENLQTARVFLSKTEERVILSNTQESIKYYGMRVVDYIFKKLQQEFPSKIDKVIIDVADDHCSLVTAQILGYKDINHNKV